MDKRFLSILAVIIVLFVGIFIVSQNSGSGGSGGSNKNSQSQPTNHVEGQGSSGVKLVEYGDYECSVCYEYYQPLKQIYDKFSDQIYFQFRNLPLTQIHPNAFAGARAAEAAGLQSKYWQMHDQLYDNQDPTGATGWVASKNPLDNYFVKFAQSIGLDVNKFKEDYGSEQVNNSINADLNAYTQTGQPMATPSFFLDGQHLDNSQLTDNNGVSVDKFSKLIQDAIDKKTNKS